MTRWGREFSISSLPRLRGSAAFPFACTSDWRLVCKSVSERFVGDIEFAHAAQSAHPLDILADEFADIFGVANAREREFRLAGVAGDHSQRPQAEHALNQVPGENGVLDAVQLDLVVLFAENARLDLDPLGAEREREVSQFDEFPDRDRDGNKQEARGEPARVEPLTRGAAPDLFFGAGRRAAGAWRGSRKTRVVGFGGNGARGQALGEHGLFGVGDARRGNNAFDGPARSIGRENGEILHRLPLSKDHWESPAQHIAPRREIE